MRVKTYYSEQPNQISIDRVGKKMAIVTLVDNVELVSGENITYAADVYTLETLWQKNLREIIEKNYSEWLNKAKQSDYNTTSNFIKDKRTALLSEVDYLFFPDYPLTDECKAEFVVYRQILRDIPEQEGFPYDVIWPKKPIVMKRL